MSWDDSDKNKHDNCRIKFKRVNIYDRKYSENGILSAFIRLCNLSVVTFQCPTYKINTDFLDIFFLCQLVIWSSVAFTIAIQLRQVYGVHKQEELDVKI